MDNLFTFLLPEFHKDAINEIINLNSLKEFVKNPSKWIKKNKLKIFKVLTLIFSYFFKRPKIKELDYQIKGCLRFKHAIELYNLAKQLPNNSIIVEIGAYLGRSTCFIAEAIKNKQIHFYSIDTFENQGMSEGFKETFIEYYRNVYPYKNKIKIIKDFSYNAVKKLKNLKIDLLWIDGDHSYEGCKRDIEDWSPLVNKNGLIIFHDYYLRSYTKVAKAVDEKIKENKLKAIKRIGTLLITKKN